MKIACLTTLDNGNTLRHLARGLRRHTGADATAYCHHQDWYLHVPDPTIDRWNNYPEIPDADAYIISDHTFIELHPPAQTHPQFWNHPVLVKCNGHFARANGPFLQHRISLYPNPPILVTSPCDYTLASAVGFSIQTLGPLTDKETYPPTVDREPPSTIRISHCARPGKGTPQILKTLQPYRRKKNIEIDIITETPWQECMTRRAKTHIHIDQWPSPQYNMMAFGISTVEALIQGCIAINGPLHPYVQHHLPDHPIIERPSLSDSLDTAIELLTSPDSHPGLLTYMNNEAAKWATEHFDVSTQAPRWHELLTWMAENT